MALRDKIALGLLFLTIGLIAAFSIFDIAIAKPPANYVSYMGTEWNKLDPRIAFVIYAHRITIGAFGLATVVGLTALVVGPVRRGEPWARWSVGLMVSLIAVILPLGTLKLGMGPNLFVPPVLGIMTLVGLALFKRSPD